MKHRNRDREMDWEGEIDWEELAVRVGLRTEAGSGEAARRALELLLGEDALRGAVDYYIEGRRGFELARSVLWQLHPWSAMARCHEIYESSNDIEVRRAAVELLRVVADRRALPWVIEFLDDEDDQVQIWGIGILDQLLSSKLVEPDDVEQLLVAAERHENASVRKTAAFVRDLARERTAPRD